jgi:predicted nucleic acid-binding protein
MAEIRSSKSWELVGSTTELFAEGLSLHGSRYDKDWSLTDCISFVLMQHRRLQRALAHDHHFEQAGFQALLRRDPS